MSGFTGHPRVVAAVNIVVMAGLGALVFYMDSGLRSPRQGTGFVLGMVIVGAFELFWIWIFIVNPRDWAKVEDGRLHWRHGQIVPCTESVSVLDVSQLLTETLLVSDNSRRGGNVDRHWVILKNGKKFQIPEAATELEVLHSMRALNPDIERRCVSKPWSVS